MNTKSLVFVSPLGPMTHPYLMRREYLPELARVRAQREATLQKKKEESTARMLADLSVDRASNPSFSAQDRWNPDEEEQGEEDDGGELNIIDKSAFISGNSAPSVFIPSVMACRPFQRKSLVACPTGADLACAVYPLLVSLANCVVACESCLEASDGGGDRMPAYPC